MDALSDLVRTFRLSGSMFFRVRLRSPYGVTAAGVDQIAADYIPEAEARQLIPFHLVTRGPMWVDIEGSGPVCLQAGDIIVIPNGATHSLVDRPGRDAIPVSELKSHITGSPSTLDWGGSGETAEALCGFFRCESRLFNPLIRALPDVLVIPHDSEQSAWLMATLEHTFTETQDQRAGRNAIVDRLTELLFLEVVQRHLAGGDAGGWLGALSDPVVGAALTHLHDEPERAWTLESLARACNASRSTLAQRFTERVGISPMRYLTEWRMELAAQRLEETSQSIGEIALISGYESEAAFNGAFKRHTGEPPAAWRRRRVPKLT